MKIATFNINGIKARIGALSDWLDEAQPDVAILQEIKSVDENFRREMFEDKGYNVETHGQKGFNGVAIMSKLPLEDVTRGLPGDDSDEQARWIEATVVGEKAVRLCGLYLPNGNPAPGPKYDYKVAWMERLHARAQDLLELEQHLSGQNYDYEMLVVVDGSPDNTAEVARNYGSQVSNLRVIDNSENHGKGYVVRQGLLEAKGEYRVFLDADGSTSITHLDKFLPQFKKGYDVVIGSRDIEGAYIQVHQPRMRELMGDAGNWLIRIVLGLWKYPDTQCGFKMLTGKAADEVASRMVVDRFGFDFELIILAEKLGFKVKQMPVRWLNEEGTTVGLFGPNGFVQVLIDLFKTKWRLLTGKYNIKKKK